MSKSSSRPLTPTRVVGAGLLCGALALIGCSESKVNSTVDTGAGATTSLPGGAVTSVPGDGSIVSRYAGAEWFGGKVPATATKADPNATPVKVGIMSADNGAIAALPELHKGNDAAIAWINDELGGVGGHPIVAVFCEVDLSPEKSQLCARKMAEEKVVAVLSGVDLQAGAAVQILNENNIPWVGGIPISSEEMKSVNTFQFSGGTPGAFVAFSSHAAIDKKFKKVSVMYLDVAQVKAAAVDYGVNLLKKLGVDVTEVAFDLTTQDYATVAQKAAEGNPDAIFVGAADFACPKVIQALADLKSAATVYMVGACADKKWLKDFPIEAIKGLIFNIENRLDQNASNSADTEVYNAAMTKYQPETSAMGAATVSFKGTMNLWAILNRVGPTGTSTDVIAEFRTTKDEPSFDGHPYTCDGKQIPALPGLCAPQQVLIQLESLGKFSEASNGWIEVPKIVADNL